MAPMRALPAAHALALARLIPHVACPAAHPPRADGNAAKDGRVQVGDVLTKCSAVLLKAGKEGEYEREGYGQR